MNNLYVNKYINRKKLALEKDEDEAVNIHNAFKSYHLSSYQ